jgi:hypothetical protein
MSLCDTTSLGFQHFHLSVYSLFHGRTGATALKALQKAFEFGAAVSLSPASQVLIPHHLTVTHHEPREQNVPTCGRNSANIIEFSA